MKILDHHLPLITSGNFRSSFQAKPVIVRRLSFIDRTIKVRQGKVRVTGSLTEKNYRADNSYYSDLEVTIYGQ